MIETKKALMQTDMPDLTLMHRGKVRDVYDLGKTLLIVATDRISAFDCVLPNGLPGKGKVLTEISLFWFGFLESDSSHHLISANVSEYPKILHKYRDQLEGRSMWVKKAKLIPIECIVRGYITGSGWKEYFANGSVCGIVLPEGLQKSQRLEAPLFTPSTKAIEGHDENISFECAIETVGEEVARDLKKRSLSIYQKATNYANERGIILCDTKFEFGYVDGEITLIDEVLTPDSSRFWEVGKYQVGIDNESFDKQIVRDYLEGLDWDKRSPAPELPAYIMDKAMARYREIVHRLQRKVKRKV
jgi:phosphoribosylaminoimidazole-succinocarboxamide synthase